MIPLVFFFLLFFVSSAHADCSSCTDSGKVYCVESTDCYDAGNETCATPIKVSFNCPTSPRVPYDDTFMRTWIMVIATAAQNENPQLCFDNQLPSTNLYQVRTVNCSTDYPDVTCVGFTAYDTKQKAIILSFKGAHGKDQIKDGLLSGAFNGTVPFFNNGRVMQVFYESFMLLWNGGIQQDLRKLIYLYPDYELWVTGHSLGGMLTTIGSAYIAKTGLFSGERMKVVALAAMAVGDLEFAKYHWDTFPYSFHIVHRNDPAPRNSMVDPVHHVTLYHQRTEVWYDNYMNPGDPYMICEEADGPYCDHSADQSIAYAMDHLYYFNIHLPDWGHDGCPKNQTAYQQP